MMKRNLKSWVLTALKKCQMGHQRNHELFRRLAFKNTTLSGFAYPAYDREISFAGTATKVSIV